MSMSQPPPRSRAAHRRHATRPDDLAATSPAARTSIQRFLPRAGAAPATPRLPAQLGIGALQLHGLSMRHLPELRTQVSHAIGMVALELLAVGARDLVARRAARDAEHGPRIPARGRVAIAPWSRRREQRAHHARHDDRQDQEEERADHLGSPPDSARSRKRKNSLFGERITVVPVVSAERYASSVRWNA